MSYNNPAYEPTENAFYFIMRSASLDNIIKGIKYGIWTR
jgi:hypothetical protein